MPESATLPVPLTSLVGRAKERALVSQLLAATRLLTLTGPGGAGKTRLALAVAAEQQSRFPDGVFFVRLALINDASLVLPAIAHAVGTEERSDQPLNALLQQRLSSQRMLLVLDNLEHVLGAAPQLAELLAATSQLKLLVTSRAALRLTGEQAFAVPPLSLPAGGAPSEAVELFVARAQALNPDFAMNETNATQIAAICRRLDGLPLAIELAAARTGLLPLATLLAWLEQPQGAALDVLGSAPADAPERHHTLRQAIAWSSDLLAPSEQRMFRRLAVFVGSLPLAAAAALYHAPTPPAGPAVPALPVQAYRPLETLELLAALARHHLIRPVPTPPTAEPNFAMLATIREFGNEQLAMHGELTLARAAHAQYLLGLAEDAAAALHGSEQIAWLDQLDSAQPDLRVALEWTLETGATGMALRFGAALWWFWFLRGYSSEGRRWLERLFAHLTGLEDPALLASAQLGAGTLALFQGDYALARHYLAASAAFWRARAADPAERRAAQRTLTYALTYLVVTANLQSDTAAAAPLIAELEQLSGQIDDPAAQGLMLFNYGRGELLQRGNYQAAGPYLAQSLALFRRTGDTWSIIQSLLDLGLVALYQDDAPTAQQYYAEAAALARELRDRALLAQALNNLGEAARYQGDDEAATVFYHESLALQQQLGNRPEIPRLLHNLGFLALHRGDLAEAAHSFGESLARFDELGMQRGVAENLAGFAALHALRGRPSIAARLWGAAEALQASGGTPTWPADRREQQHYQALAGVDRARGPFAAAWQSGSQLSAAAAIAIARSDDTASDDGSAQATHPDALTTRELEVLRLIAAGLSNQAIADQLHLSTYTVQNHLRNIYGKLGVTSRSAAARYAWEQGLIKSDHV